LESVDIATRLQSGRQLQFVTVKTVADDRR